MRYVCKLERGLTVNSQDAYNLDRDERVEVFSRGGEGIWTNTKTGEHHRFVVWNISDNGICIWSTHEISEGHQLVLTFSTPFLLVVNCSLSWCEPQTIGTGYRCGLSVTDDLPKVFESLKEDFENS